MPASHTDRLRRIAERMSEITGVTWTLGYIGNIYPDCDDRSWFLFAAHPGRVGTYADRIGGVDTKDLHILVNVAQGALAMARYMSASK